MDFTDREKRMIVAGLETEWGDNREATAVITNLVRLGTRFKGEALEEAIQVFDELQILLHLEKKIFESLDDGEEKQGLLNDINQNISEFNRCKEIVDFFQGNEQPQTDDSEGVLGDKAQD